MISASFFYVINHMLIRDKNINKTSNDINIDS